MVTKNRSTLRLLLVDDDEIIGNLLSIKTTQLHIEMSEARDGIEALELLQKNTYDLVLLDLRMPRKDGFEVLREIKKDVILSKTPVWVLSNLGQKKEVDLAMQLGAKKYFIKANIDINDLMKKIMTFAEDKHQTNMPTQ